VTLKAKIDGSAEFVLHFDTLINLITTTWHTRIRRSATDAYSWV